MTSQKPDERGDRGGRPRQQEKGDVALGRFTNWAECCAFGCVLSLVWVLVADPTGRKMGYDAGIQGVMLLGMMAYACGIILVAWVVGMIMVKCAQALGSQEITTSAKVMLLTPAVLVVGWTTLFCLFVCITICAPPV